MLDLKTPAGSRIQFMDNFSPKLGLLSARPTNSPLLYVDKDREEIVAVDWAHCGWMSTYPGYCPTTVVHYKRGQNQHQNKIEVVFQKVWNKFSVSELTAFFLEKIGFDNNDLIQQVSQILDTNAKVLPG